MLRIYSVVLDWIGALAPVIAAIEGIIGTLVRLAVPQ